MRARFSTILICLVTLVSCTKDFDEINLNPNQPTTVNIDHLFTETLVVGAGQFNTTTHTEHWALAVWVQQVADINGINNAANPYAYSGDWNDELWSQLYAQALSPVNEIVRLTKDDAALINKNAIARIWRAYLFHRITDLWGDVPYTDALQGVSNSGTPILQPAYDTQESIYSDLLNELKDAAAALDINKADFGPSDILYSGNIDYWKKFANSLRLRLAIRIKNANPSLAQEHLDELFLENNFISANSEGAHIRYDDVNRHPFYELAVSGQGLRNPSYFFIKLLQNSNDPRVEKYAEPTAYSLIFGGYPYQGVPNLMTSVELNSNGFDAFSTSTVGEYFLAPEIEGTIMSYAEVSFLQAEAALNNWGAPLSANEYYDNGVTAAMQWIAVSSEDILSYLEDSGTFDGTLEKIITQKWISLVYRDAYEAYAEFRRTGYPVLKDLDGNDIDLSIFPNRFAYPTSELTLNSENVNEVGEGVNDFYTPVWWDQ